MFLVGAYFIHKTSYGLSLKPISTEKWHSIHIHFLPKEILELGMRGMRELSWVIMMFFYILKGIWAHICMHLLKFNKCTLKLCE